MVKPFLDPSINDCYGGKGRCAVAFVGDEVSIADFVFDRMVVPDFLWDLLPILIELGNQRPL
jgi:hypothetical protein